MTMRGFMRELKKHGIDVKYRTLVNNVNALIRALSDDDLQRLIELGAVDPHDIVPAYALRELVRRRKPLLTPELLNDVVG